MKRLVPLLAAFLLHAPTLFAQERTVTGKVTAREDGTTIPGVTVVVKGTTVGTTTNSDGNYSIPVPAGGTHLVFTALGMKMQEAEIGASTVVDAVMEPDVLKLDEVVVTANAIQREKRSLGYAVSSVSGDELTKGRDRSVLNAVQGKVAGVQVTNASGSVGSSTRMVIRGGTSFLGNNQPLYVVDGIPIDNA